MATTLYNGSVNGKSNDGTSASYTFYLEVILNSQSVANNTSNITINHYAKGNSGYNYSEYSSPKSYIKIYDNNTGTTVTKKTTTVKSIGSSKVKIGTWTGNVTHKSDGTLTIKVTADYKPNDSTWYLPADKSLNSGNLVLNPLHKVPDINGVTFIENNPTLINAGISNDTFVARLSNKTVTADVTYYDNATLSQMTTVVSSTIYNRNTNPAVIDLENCNIASDRTLIILEITDSLNAKNTLGISKDSVPYILPTLIPTESRIKRNGQTSGKAKMSLKGTFYNNAIGNINNSINLSFAYAERGQEPVLYHTIPSNAYTINGNDITMDDWEIAINGEEIEDLDKELAYTFRIKIEDSMNKSTIIDLLCPSGEYLMCQFKDRVDFKKITVKNTTIPTSQILYEDTLDTGKNTTVTLSETAANFEYLEIYYYTTTRSVYGDNSTKIAKPDGKTTTLRCDAYTNNYHYMTIGNVSISGTSITWNHQTRIRIADGAASTITTGVNTMYITKVIGYKI